MKKILTVVFCAALTLLFGGVLTACSGGATHISFSLQRSDLVSVEVEVDGESVRAGSDGRYQVATGSNVRVRIYARQYGVDMSGLHVVANGKERQVWTYNSDFDSLTAGGDLYFGYVLFPDIDSSLKIEISGVESFSNEFAFENVEGTEAEQRLKMAYIKLPGSPMFVNFYNFLQEGKPFTIDIVGQNSEARSFQMKFVGSGSNDGIDPYVITHSNPFQLQYENSEHEVVTRGMQGVSYSGGIYTFSLGEIENKAAVKILTDFQDLECREFTLSLPQDNMTFETSVESGKHTLSYETSDKITVTKVMADAVMNKSAVKAYLNNRQLQLDSQSENTDQSLTFVLPSGITPSSTGGEADFKFRLTGITYPGKSVVTLNSSTFESYASQFVQPNFFAVDGNGQRSKVVGYDDAGNQIAFQNTKMALYWKYPSYNDIYYTPCDIYDYDVLQNGSKLFNIKEMVADGEDDLVIEQDSFTLRAFVNPQTHKYDEFQLEFQATANTNFVFQSFKLLEKEVAISYDFDDERVESVAFAIASDSTSVASLAWTSLTSVEDTKHRTMTFGQSVFFRLKVRGDVSQLGDGKEFTLQDSLASRGGVPQSFVMRANSDNYLVLAFPLADVFFEGEQSMQLILASSQIRL